MEESKQIVYKDGYKFQLTKSCTFRTPINPSLSITTKLIQLDTKGVLTIKGTYAWDGPTGVPRFKWLLRKLMRSSLVHDAFYQLLRNEKLPPSFREDVDKLFRAMSREDGIFWWSALIAYFLVRKFGKYTADPANKKKEIKAP